MAQGHPAQSAFYVYDRSGHFMLTEALENPKAIEMFVPEPSLECVILTRLLLDREGPTVTMHVQLRDYPARPPAKWHLQQHNTVVMELQAMGVEHFLVKGWTVDNNVSISIERLADRKLKIRAVGASVEIELRCGWLRVVGVTPYCRECPREGNGAN
jgi:hypothetical protein